MPELSGAQPVGAVLDHAVGLFKAAVSSVLVLAFASALVRNLPYLYTSLPEILSSSGVPVYAADPDQLVNALGEFLIGAVVTWPVGIFLGLGVIMQIDAAAHGRTLPWQTALGLAWQKLLPLAGCLAVYVAVFLAIFGTAVVLSGLAVRNLAPDLPVAQVAVVAGAAGMATSLAAAVPLTVLFVYWCLALPLVATENLRAVSALRKSWELVRGNWWRVLTIVSVAGFVVFALESLAGIAGMSLIAATDGAFLRTAAVLLNAAVGTVTTPLFLAALLAVKADVSPRRAT